MPLSKPVAERFWPRVRKTEGCWLWEGARDTAGYGSVRIGPTTIKTHRIAWELIRGPIPAGRYLLHSCDNPPCCNPDHLRLGTAAENLEDRLQRGSGRSTPRQWIAPIPSIVPPEQRFWSKVLKTEGCWLWQGGVYQNGQGFVTEGSEGKILARVLSWRMHYGPEPTDSRVMQTCMTTACVRPDHLILQTKGSTLRKASAGRKRAGESHQMAKLTEAQVREIRARFANRKLVAKRTTRGDPDSMPALAREFSVSLGTIADILYRKTWAHID